MELGLPCVHCGLCLDKCPTYRDSGTEAESPRGRIYIMEAVKEGELALDVAASQHLDSCLGCLACEPACPSGVDFHRRIEEFRPKLRLPLPARAWRRIAGATMRSRPLALAALGLARAIDASGLHKARRRVPGLGLLPARSAGHASRLQSPADRCRVVEPVRPRATAVLLSGCVADTVLPNINRDAIEVLRRNGVQVTVVAASQCCGALALHEGDNSTAIRLARNTAEQLARSGADYVVTTAAGCTAMLRDYKRLLNDHPDSDVAAFVSSKTRDVCELLVEIGFEAPAKKLTTTGPVAYHDACHLLNACAISSAPRAIVEAATGHAPDDLGENEICCGSAGSYNVRHPAIAGRLAARKAQLVVESGAATIAVGNAGCLLQIEQACGLAGTKARFRHPVELLADAYRLGERA